MWDCKYKNVNDFCSRRRMVCFPGGIACVLKGKYKFPLRSEEDPLKIKNEINRKNYNNIGEKK